MRSYVDDSSNEVAFAFLSLTVDSVQAFKEVSVIMRDRLRNFFLEKDNTILESAILETRVTWDILGEDP